VKMMSEKEQIRKQLSAEGLKLEFGKRGKIYPKIVDDLKSLWERAKYDENVRLNFNSWKDSFEIVYGCEPEQELFIIHTYLAALVKIIIYFKLETFAVIDKKKLAEIINGRFFLSYGILNFVENDFSTWVVHSEVAEDGLELLFELAKELSKYDFSQIDEDFFKEIYEEMIERGERHKAGEYYTPDWLTQLILSEVLKLWEKSNKNFPRILDPACGSGTFLCNAVHFFKEKIDKHNLMPDRALDIILGNVVGIDINPLACMLAKANYIIALGDLVKKGVLINLPIIRADALKLQSDVVGQFDILVGNPPWIVMRSIKNRPYQDYLKRETLKYKLLNKDNVHLFTQMEIATLFFCKCGDLYLKNNGIIGFVMPRSVISGTIQHINFRRPEVNRLKLTKILDLEEVHPLFNMPSCVLIAIKGKNTKYPVLAERYKGELSKKNARLNEVGNLLSTRSYMYLPPEFPAKPSYYFDKFKVGASIFPRTLYFIDILSQSDNTLSVRTSKKILHMAKAPWKVELEGKIELKFIYATLLAWEIVPFGYIRLRPIILPVEPLFEGYKLFDPADLKKAKFVHVADWFKKAQKIWEERRTEKSEKRFPKLMDRLDYNGLLTSQNHSKRYVVLYNATGTNLVSCVIDRLSLPSFNFSKDGIKPTGFVVDVKSWFYETDDEMEAYFLSAIFNSEIINTIIKPLQPRGLFGARAIHRRPLLFKVPKFDKNKKLHVELAEIGRHCHENVKQAMPLKNNNTRSYVRKHFKNEIIKINNLVLKLLENMPEVR